MLIQVAGPGCAKCKTLEANVREACSQLGLDVEIQHLSNPKDYAPLGVTLTPAIIANGKILINGNIASIEDLKEKITAFQKNG